MALNAHCPNADGLRSAMMAVAALHVARPSAALGHKVDAIHSLSRSMAMGVPDKTTLHLQLATSMMLCVYNVSRSMRVR